MNLMHVAGVVVTVALTIAAHMGARVFHAPEDNATWRIARYVMGCAAILVGVFFVVEWSVWLTVAGIVAVAGISTITCYLVVELYNYHNRAVAAEDDADQHYEL